MEGCRRLSLCACAHHFSGPLSDRAGELQEYAGRRWRRPWSCRRWWRRIGWRPAAVREAEDARCRCCSSGRAAKARRSAEGGSAASTAGGHAPSRRDTTDSNNGGRPWNGPWYSRQRRSRTRQRRWNRLRHWNGNGKLEWSWNRWRPSEKLSANANSILSSAAPRAIGFGWTDATGVSREVTFSNASPTFNARSSGHASEKLEIVAEQVDLGK